MGHLGSVDLCGHHVAHEQQFGVRVIDDVVDLVCRELMQDGHGHRPIGECGQESARPCRAVSSAERNFVASLHARTFKHDVQLGDLAGYVVVL